MKQIIYLKVLDEYCIDICADGAGSMMEINKSVNYSY